MFIPERVKLLYIEDDECSADLTLEYLKLSKHTKFEVVKTCTLEEGLNYLRKNCSCEKDCDIDVILLDLVLPNSHGVATYVSLVEVCDFIPVVIISGHEDLACKCIKLGAQDYLLKPTFTQGTLTRSLRYAIERDKLEKSKLEAERRFRQVIHSTPIGFHNYEIVNDELIFSGYNPAADEILNIDHSEFVGKKITEVFPSLIGTDVPEKYKQVALTGEPWNAGILEYKDERIDKGFFRVNVFRTSPNCVTSSFEDVTYQIETERKYKNLLEASNAGIYQIDFKTGKFTYVNKLLANKLGYTVEELYAMTAFDILTKESTERWMKRLEQLKYGEFIDKSTEYEAVRKNGEILYVIITAEYIEDDDGDIVGANVVAIDITESKRAKEEASKKEEMLFNELEKRIHQWREEITENISEKSRDKSWIKNLQNMASQSEVM